MNNFSIVLLSNRPDLKQLCCQLLGEEWKRSDAARLHGLSPNSKDLPDSLLLLGDSEGTVKLIGHSRLSRVLEDNHGCWIASVIISKEKRGQGLGRYLMVKTEDYAKVLGFTTVYLNTHDKQRFYENLGYIYCNPVTPHKGGVSLNGARHLSNFHHQVLGIREDTTNHPADQLDNTKTSKNSSVSSVKTSSAPIPPPPPPSLLTSYVKDNSFSSATGHYWMKKYL